ncbi:MAG: transposase [Bacteroidota bacterium]
MKRRKFTPKFKAKVVLEALKERETVRELSQKYELSPQQINLWKREFLSNAGSVFSGGTKRKKSEVQEKEEQLLKTIGQLKVENDFLKNALS